MTYTLEIVSPIPGKGLDREVFARAAGRIIDEYNTEENPHANVTSDEKNEVDLGLVVKLDGVPVKNVNVQITATDNNQNRTYASTGNQYPVFDENGTRTLVPYYPFHYQFLTEGDHVITFRAEGEEVSKTFTAALDTRPSL